MPKSYGLFEHIALWALAVAGEPGDDEKTRWHTILTVGERKGTPALGPKKVTVTGQILDFLVARFSKERPIGIHHATAMAAKTGDPRWMVPDLSAAYGWLHGLRRKGDDLQALIAWNDEGWSLVDGKKFKYLSIEIGREQDPATGELSAPEVVGGTLTNTPFWDLPALAASNAVDLSGPNTGGEHAAGLDVPEWPGATQRNNGGYMPSAIEKLCAALGVGEDKVGDHVSGLVTELAATKTALATKEAESKSFDERLTALATRVEASEKATAKAQAEQFVEKLLFTGRIKLDEKDDVLEMHGYKPEIAEKFYGSRAAGSAVPVGQLGHDVKDESSAGDAKVKTVAQAGEKLHELTLAKQGKSDGMDYMIAFEMVMNEQPALAAAYHRGEA